MKRAIWIAVAAFIVPFGCVSQEDMSALDHRLSRMEQQAKGLHQQYLALEDALNRLNTQIETAAAERGGNELDLRSQAAKLYARVENLGDQVQRLSGRIEETDYALKEKSDEIQDQGQQKTEKMLRIEATANLNADRVGRVEQYLGFETSDKLGATVAADGLEGEALSHEELYAASKQAFDRNDFEVSRQGFQRLLRQFPRSDNADNAQFWLGETYYREQWYEKAILEYQKVIEKYPKGNKVPASLLKQGIAFFNLRDKANARLIFEELAKKFPKSAEAGVAKKRLRDLN